MSMLNFNMQTQQYRALEKAKNKDYTDQAVAITDQEVARINALDMPDEWKQREVAKVYRVYKVNMQRDYPANG